ncbi:response regulator [Mucilaginibacter angelicae]|uniref:Response regulator n=1 Tax=Mucilaginibacter angelicae TaxID=869718 RepID=A0ABV6L5Y4_9SPHI
MNQSIAQAGVLYIDDTVCKLDEFKNQYKHLFAVYTASTMTGGRHLLALNEIAVVIINQLMPGSTGISFLELATQTNPRTIRVLLTGFSDSNIVADVVNMGIVHKTIAKPWQSDDMKYTIQNALEVYDLRKQNLELTYKVNTANYETDRAIKQHG